MDLADPENEPFIPSLSPFLQGRDRSDQGLDPDLDLDNMLKPAGRHQMTLSWPGVAVGTGIFTVAAARSVGRGACRPWAKKAFEAEIGDDWQQRRTKSLHILVCDECIVLPSSAPRRKHWYGLYWRCRSGLMQSRIRLTRQQLYDLVWQKSISRLVAEDFAISGVGLAKVCARHGVPTPPRGYWAQIDAGKLLARPKLPAGDDRTGIDLPPARPKDESPEARNQLATEIANEKDPARRIAVAERLHSPCELVSQTKLALEGVDADSDGLVPSPKAAFTVHVSRQAIPRALRIADAFAKALTARGWEMSKVGAFSRPDFGTAEIAFSIEESLAAEQRELPPDLSSSYYSFHHSRRSEVVRKPSGRLTLSLREQPALWSQIRRKWHDSEKHSLEDLLNDAVIGLLRLAAALRIEVAQREKDEREAVERRRQVQLALDEQKRLRAELAAEKARVDALRAQADRWSESEHIRRFVAQARAKGELPEMGIHGEELERWAEWANAQADRMDPLKPSPTSILDDAERIEHMCDQIQWRR